MGETYTSIRVTEEFRDELKRRKPAHESYETFLKRKLDEPAPAPAPAPAPPEPDSEVVRFVRDNQPVQRSEILEHCVPDDFHGKDDSWWQRHGRPVLKTSDAEFVNGTGWIIER